MVKSFILKKDGHSAMVVSLQMVLKAWSKVHLMLDMILDLMLVGTRDLKQDIKKALVMAGTMDSK